jgi:cysteine desulfurase / selenocysteine lyase
VTGALDVARLRDDFPLLSRRVGGRPLTYLDSAATALRPRAVIDAVVHYYTDVGANIHRGKHLLSEEASRDYERARTRVAEALGALGNEVVFTAGATAALNMVAAGLGLSRGDLVVGVVDAHHSNLLPWMQRADLRLARLGRDGTVDLEHFASLLALGPRVVALTHRSNVTGLYAPIEEMARLAREVGAIVVLDAAQSAPHRRLNADELGVDFLACSGHKLMGPSGIGVLYGRRERLETLEPAFLGGGAVDWVEAGGYRVRKIPHRLESGTPNIAGAYGLEAALAYLERVGLDAVEAHDRALGRALLDEALRRDYLEPLCPDAKAARGATLSLRLRGWRDLATVARSLSDAYGIMCRSGHLCAQPLVDALGAGEVLRVSAYLYNTTEEIAAFFAALDELRSRLGV